MLSGRSVLRDLARELERAHARHATAASAVRDIESRHGALLEEEGRIVEDLARLYLPELSPAAVSAGVAGLRHRLEQALAAQEKRRERLADDASQAAKRFETALARADVLEKEAEALDERLGEARARVEAALDGADGHTGQVEEHTALVKLRQRLLKRRERLGATALAERSSYEEDRLFRYLHDRGFGGPEYHAGPVTRRLDRWLARRIDYETLARNYRILKVGPYQIGARIRRLGQRAEEIEETIDAREEAAARAEGLLPLLRQRAELEARMGETRSELEQARAVCDALESELRAVEANRGRHFEEAVELYRDHLEEKTVRELEALARSTPDSRDDGMVRELEGVRAKLEDLTRELALHRDQMQRLSERADRLAELHTRGLQRLAWPTSFFADGFDIGAILESFLSGHASSAQSIEELAASRVERPFVGEVPRPYFDALYRELTAAFDEEALEGAIVTADWDLDGEVETEVLVHDAQGRIIRRRVTRRSLGE